MKMPPSSPPPQHPGMHEDARETLSLTVPLDLDAVPDPEAVLTERFRHERTARKAAEELLSAKNLELTGALTQARDSERRLQLALWASGEGIWEWQAGDDVMTLERLEIGGNGEMAWTLRPMSEVQSDIHPDDLEAILLAWESFSRGSQPSFDMAFRLLHQSGYRWVRMRGRALLHDADERPTRVTGTIKDITGQRDSEESLRLMAHAFSSTRDALAVTDEHWHIIEANSAMCSLLGTSIARLRSSSLLDFVDLAQVPLEALHGGGAWRGERTMTLGARRVPGEVSITAVAGHENRGTCYIVALHDISERKHVEARLVRLTLQDPLTELPNRAALEGHLEARLLSGSGAQSFGLLFMDLDGFKEINDSFSHEAGDQLLREVARRLRSVLPEGCYIGRWGGDEFVVVLPPGSDEAQVRAAGHAVISMFHQSLRIGTSQVSVSASMGGAMAPRDGDQPGTLLRRVDAAMYAAKDQGRNRLVFYDPSLETDAQRRVRLLGLLRNDVDRNGFRFAAQPKVDREGRVVSAEVLMRWTTDVFGAVSPSEFIPLAEQAGLIHLLGKHAVQAAAQLVSHMRTLGHHGLTIAVNLSPKQLQDASLEASLLAICEAEGISPSLLELELTESALVSGMDIVRPLLVSLRNAGFSLALDDFGTGYSSLSYLRHLPFNKVKIDRSFVMDIHKDPRAALMLDGIVRLCNGLEMTTVAEGVETLTQFEALLDMGVHEFQGYYFSKPMLVSDWLKQLQESPSSALQLPRRTDAP